ncbi:Aspartokinase [Bathymodiolus thermophilus thioautotrophic gill symbiont]|uniref:Aspartokinase n=1 Tax=Bathymodiolus thermophilus thioautotrophic gill symbiont TaxID=2360 RepID=A0A1J5TYB3_9GAMM|nr:aspartate kinase [Bathymodiolus thermophilus thioautotrophic gill symbiont]AYQ56837.1 Aspartokinase [Bathymodiolus thermophilus thioautotrophic gill symbiont]OIR25738.1 aspartate kinase [Bathymodiolus thermophilus thioautotrophic gill symbiont]CAB5495787.1 Aspartokinase (EC [Bathymodiolus thermophilus thioautotrophic gill symbiont]CAB5499544.1 Aspartokinase (EC [Bathymodiolus thermophilus thioautotrophic gill symbiont]SHA28105.1 Aspartokinase [Bathymodiolus thermophilus thioautotrophic gill
MALIVQKYGGTSVGSVERIQAVAEKIKTFVANGDKLVVSVSAMSGETNRMTELAQQIQDTPSLREMDVLLTTGEQVTISLLAMALQQLGCEAISYTGSQVRITTDSAHGKARIKSIDDHRIHASLNAGKIVVVAGFQGVDEQGNITTLGRGGSDTTAVALAAALKADECQIYTDVDGVYTTDPRIEPNARKMNTVSYEEMLEMASLGSKVLQIRSVEFASKYKVPLRVLSSLIDNPIGTLITSEENIMEQAVISGIAHNKDEAKLSLIGVPDEPGIAYKILKPISEANIEVDMIVQSVSAREGLTNFAFTVHRNDFDRAQTILQSICNELEAKAVQSDDKVVKVSLVGIGMRSHAGIAAQMFEVLHQENVNIQMISTSEIKISVVIGEKYLELAVRSLHAAFGLDKE